MDRKPKKKSKISSKIVSCAILIFFLDFRWSIHRFCVIFTTLLLKLSSLNAIISKYLLCIGLLIREFKKKGKTNQSA